MTDMSTRSGSIEALGWERPEFGNPKISIPSIGLVVSGALMILILYVPYVGSELVVSISICSAIAFGVFMAVLLYYRSVAYNPKKITLYYTLDRVGGGHTTMSYTNQRNKMRTDLRVKAIEPRPEFPLFKPSGKYEFAVRGTLSSLRIRFEGRLMVELGFPDESTMMEAFRQMEGSWYTSEGASADRTPDDS